MMRQKRITARTGIDKMKTKDIDEQEKPKHR